MTVRLPTVEPVDSDFPSRGRHRRHEVSHVAVTYPQGRMSGWTDVSIRVYLPGYVYLTNPRIAE